jgi:hypothetical protein
VFWEWGQPHIVGLVRGCIRQGHHPGQWETAKGIVIPKPNKPDYSQVHAYQVITLPIVKRTAAHLLADYLERGSHLHEGQFGCRKRRATVDAVAELMNPTECQGGLQQRQ